MNYLSTRGHQVVPSFSDILLGGLAPDGGLYLPVTYPQVTEVELNRWRGLSYAALASELLKKFATDIPSADIDQLTARTYTASVYRNVRAGEAPDRITPLRTLEASGDNTLLLQALSNGPTLAFKDMAMQLLGNLFEYTLKKRNAELNIFGATSGDTGSAAEYAMRGKQGIRVFMLSPHQKMSAFQCAQMFSLQDPNIFNIAVKGVLMTARTWSRRFLTIWNLRRVRKSAQLIPLTGPVSWRRWCITFVVICQLLLTILRKCHLPCHQGILGISVLAISPA